MAAKIVNGRNVHYGLADAASTGAGRHTMTIIGAIVMVLGLVAAVLLM